MWTHFITVLKLLKISKSSNNGAAVVRVLSASTDNS